VRFVVMVVTKQVYSNKSECSRIMGNFYSPILLGR